MLAVQDKVTECGAAWTPVPDRAIALGEPVALLVTVTVAVALPAAVGLKITPKVSCCPAVNVTGVPAPVRLNPVPLSAICEIVTLEFPEFVTVTFCVDDEPVFTLPNARLELLNDSVLVAATAVPLKARAVGELGALLTMLTVPLAVPAGYGSKLNAETRRLPGAESDGK